LLAPVHPGLQQAGRPKPFLILRHPENLMKGRTAIILSMCVFALALTQDGYYIDHNPRDAWAPGWGEFAVGWIGLFSGTFAWLGNPLLIASWIAIFRKKAKASAWLSASALLIMLSFLHDKTIIFNENGSSARITGYGLGYVLWVASGVAALIGASMGLATRKPGDPKWANSRSLEGKGIRQRTRSASEGKPGIA